MINTAIVGLGWWGKTLVRAARDFGAPLRFVRGVTLEPDTVRDFADEHKIAIGTSIDEVNKLLAARKQMQKMMKQMGKGKMPGLPPELTGGKPRR